MNAFMLVFSTFLSLLSCYLPVINCGCYLKLLKCVSCLNVLLACFLFSGLDLSGYKNALDSSSFGDINNNCYLFYFYFYFFEIGYALFFSFS